MNIDQNILTLITFVPLVGAVVLALLPDRGKTMQWGALAVTLVTFLLTLHLPFRYLYGAAAGSFQFESNVLWIANPTIRYHLGVDGLSMWLIVLTGFLAPFGVLISWKAVDERKKLFYVLFLLQQVAMMGIFVSLDLFLYYAFWEMSLVPMALLIATFGRTHDRRKAAVKYFLYAFIPSAMLLGAIIWVYIQTGTFDLTEITAVAARQGISTNAAAMWFASLAFLLAFAVKVPVFPLHGWLSGAIEEAPTAAVMVLAGKTGLYSILRFSFGIFPAESHRIAPLMMALGAIGIVYGSMLALVQNNMKRMASMSTLAHLSVITLGIFTFTVAGVDGGIYQIINHGITGGALFMLMGLLYERYATYDMREYGGLAAKLPWIVTMFVIVSLSAIGLPMLNSFVGEFLVLSGAMQSVFAHHVLWTSFATTGVILSAAYMLRMLQKVFYGDLGRQPEVIDGWDLDAREHLALWPFIILFVVMGVASPIWIKAIDAAGVAIANTLTQPQASPQAIANPTQPAAQIAAATGGTR